MPVRKVVLLSAYTVVEHAADTGTSLNLQRTVK